MKTLKSLSGALAAFVMLSQNYCDASCGCTYVKDLRLLAPKGTDLQKCLSENKMYDDSQRPGGIPEIERQVHSLVPERVTAKMKEDVDNAFGNRELFEKLSKKYLATERDSYCFAKMIYDHVENILSNAIWEENGGEMAASFNAEGVLEISYWVRGLHKSFERDKLISEILNAIVSDLYESKKLCFALDFDLSNLGTNEQRIGNVIWKSIQNDSRKYILDNIMPGLFDEKKSDPDTLKSVIEWLRGSISEKDFPEEPQSSEEDSIESFHMDFFQDILFTPDIVAPLCEGKLVLNSEINISDRSKLDEAKRAFVASVGETADMSEFSKIVADSTVYIFDKYFPGTGVLCTAVPASTLPDLLKCCPCSNKVTRLIVISNDMEDVPGQMVEFLIKKTDPTVLD